MHKGAYASAAILVCATLCVAGDLGENTSGRAIFRSQEFAGDPFLSAHAGQTVILDRQTGDPAEIAIPYSLEKGSHKILHGRA